MLKWRRSRQTASLKKAASLKNRLISFAAEVRDKASLLQPSREKDELLKKARRADTAAHLEDWANSAELKPPD